MKKYDLAISNFDCALCCEHITCIEPLVSKDIELTLPVLLLIMCPIVNTIIALKYAKWSDVKRVFKNKDVSKTC